jgi:hypothetical protein
LAAEGLQEGIREQHENHMMLPALPRTAFEMVKSQFIVSSEMGPTAFRGVTHRDVPSFKMVASIRSEIVPISFERILVPSVAAPGPGKLITST